MSGYLVDWLLALSGLSTLFTWASICLCHIRFRRAWLVQGHSVEELPFRALGGVYGSYLGLILIGLVIIAQFYVAIWPIGGMSDDPKAVAEKFFSAYSQVFIPGCSVSDDSLTYSDFPRCAYHDPVLHHRLCLEAYSPPTCSRNRPRLWPQVVAHR